MILLKDPQPSPHQSRDYLRKLGADCSYNPPILQNTDEVMLRVKPALSISISSLFSTHKLWTVTPDKATSWYFTAWGHLMSLMSLVFRAFILYPFSPWESTTISDVATRCQHLTTANAVRQRLFSPTTKAVLYFQSSSQQLCVLHTVLLCYRKWCAGNANLVNYERSRKRGSVTRRKTGRIFAKITSVRLEKPS